MSESRLVSGCPLLRLLRKSNVELSTSWHRHVQLVCPWFLDFGIQEYSQIHLHEHTLSSTSPKDETALQKILCQAEGVALGRGLPVKTANGSTRPFGDPGKHPYFATKIWMRAGFYIGSLGLRRLKATRRFFDLPVLAVDEWRRMALEMGAVEHVKIQEGKAVIDVLRWDKWKETDGKQAG